MSEKREKKVATRTLVIALGIICAVLVIGLVGAMANYTGIINGKDNTITADNTQMQTMTNRESQLQTWLNGNKTLLGQAQTWLDGNKTLLGQTQTWLNGNETSLQTEIATLNSTISSLKAQITGLQSQITNLTGIVNLTNSTIWINDKTESQPGGSPWTFSASVPYAGYLNVSILSSTAYNLTIKVIYTSHGANYNQPISVSPGESAVFPVLPSSVEIEVATAAAATETLTITYYC